VSNKGSRTPTLILGVVALLLVTVGCISVNAPVSLPPTNPAPSLAIATSDVAAPTTPVTTRRPCQPGDSRPRCQSPAPPATQAPAATPSETSSATPTQAPTPTAAPTGTPIPMPTGSTGGVDTDIAISTLQINFGNVANGTTGGPTSVTLTNTGSAGFGPINIFGGAPPTPAFNASQNCQGTTLAAGASCTVSYTFSPPTSGYYSDFSAFTISQTGSQSDGEDFTVALFGCGDTC
jgi:hypothetical protein